MFGNKNPCVLTVAAMMLANALVPSAACSDEHDFFLYDAPIGTQAPPLVGTDLWNIPSGNNAIAITGVDHDGDGVDEIAVLKVESGDYNLYIYDAPIGTQAPPLVGTDLWNIPSGNNAIAMAGVDHDGDAVDEVGVLKNTSHIFSDGFESGDTSRWSQ